MNYHALCEVYLKLESTTKRLEKAEILASFLKNVPESELSLILLLLQGRVFPVWDRSKLGFSSRYILKALSLAIGLPPDKITETWKETGDLGSCAETLMADKKQRTLFSEVLSTGKVFANLRQVANADGSGSVDVKVGLVAELLSNSLPIEARFIVRTVLDELRVGSGEGTLRDALVWAFLPEVKGVSPIDDIYLEENPNENPGSEAHNAPVQLDLNSFESYAAPCDLPKPDYHDKSLPKKVYSYYTESVQNALDLCNDFGKVGMLLKKEGLAGLKNILLEPGTPVKSMLAIKEKDAKGGLNQVGIPAAAECKLDGFRLQIHKKGAEVMLFTRRLENVTWQFPEIASAFSKIGSGNFILDSEAVGIDRHTGRFLPFQNISKRIKRKYAVNEMAEETPVEVHLFDVLYYDNMSYLDFPFNERRAVLEQFHESEFVKIIKQKLVKTEDEVMGFYARSLDDGNEGVMLKKLDAPYKPGSRVGYMVKMKPVMETLDLAVVGAEWGEGKRSGWLSSYTVACRKGDELVEVGRVSTGLKEKSEEGLSFLEMTRMLQPLILKQDGKAVIVKPEVILEVAFEEVQKSPTYGSGYALRFPRIIRLRSDRDAGDCSTLEYVEGLYNL